MRVCITPPLHVGRWGSDHHVVQHYSPARNCENKQVIQRQTIINLGGGIDGNA